MGDTEIYGVFDRPKGEIYNITNKVIRSETDKTIHFVPESEFIPTKKIQNLIIKYEKREKDPQRPPYEQEAYAFAAYDLKQLIGVSDE